MNTISRRVILALTAIQGLFVGIWAEFFPRSFYDSFPGFGLHWVSMMGEWDEHLVSDVGSFYLGLTAITIIAIFARTAGPARLAGVGWTVFGVLHFVYHATHLMGSTFDRVGNLISLGIAALLGIILLLPPRTPALRKEEHLCESRSPEAPAPSAATSFRKPKPPATTRSSSPAPAEST